MSTERLRAKLIKAGYDEDEIVEMERGDLLNTYAEYLITPPLPESPQKAGAVGGMSEAEIEFRRQELELHKQEFEWRQAERERQKREREEDLERQKQRDELQRKERGEEVERQRKEKEEEISDAITRVRFVSRSYKDRELRMRRRRNVRSPWRDKLVSMGRH